MINLFKALYIPLNSETPQSEAESHENLLAEVERRIFHLKSEIEDMEYQLPELKKFLVAYQEVQPAIVQRIKYLEENAESLAETWNWEDGIEDEDTNLE
jgi:chromosome segregation ATPase